MSEWLGVKHIIAALSPGLFKFQVDFLASFMLSATAVDLSYGDGEYRTPTVTPMFYRTASVGSWGVTSIGKGFNWNSTSDDNKSSPQRSPLLDPDTPPTLKVEVPHGTRTNHIYTDSHSLARLQLSSPILSRMAGPTPSYDSKLVASPVQSHPTSPVPPSRSSLSLSEGSRPIPSCSPSSPCTTPSSPRARRRSSRQRVSLIAGRVSIAPLEPPSPPPILPQSLQRSRSGLSIASAASTRPPSPYKDDDTFLGQRNISDYEIEGDIGRGAYGLVKRAREILSDGALGPPLVIKQVIKSRILADCWKRHPKHGTMPIEIYVMSANSNTNYILPARRPWDPSRNQDSQESQSPNDDAWVEGKTVKGHPNICPLLDYFEDSHYYYLILPSTTPEQIPDQPSPPSDLFDLVEAYPQGLPPELIRTYVGQIADALAFLHAQGIVHRDVKDENVVLGPSGKCILIDFGSSGLVKKRGWDTFSGTLDYAGPEILRGERYYGKEQDVWAFGVVGYVLLVGECPFATAEETQAGLQSPFANASIALDERCADGKEKDGEEKDGGGALGDAAELVRACLEVKVELRPTFEEILKCRFLAGRR